MMINSLDKRISINSLQCLLDKNSNHAATAALSWVVAPIQMLCTEKCMLV